MNTTTTTAFPCIPTEKGKMWCEEVARPVVYGFPQLTKMRKPRFAQKKNQQKKQTQFPFRP